MIHLDALSVDFDERFQLLDIDWKLRPGEHWLIAGANGSGKSALAAVLAATETSCRGASRESPSGSRSCPMSGRPS